MPRGIPKPKETMSDLLAKFVDMTPAPVEPLSKEEITAMRPKLRASYTEFVKRKRKRA